MFEEHDRVVLTGDLGESNLKTGDVGTIVHVYSNRTAFEVEFLALDGHSAAVATVPRSQVRPVAPTDLTHARELSKQDRATAAPHGARGRISADTAALR